MLKYHVIIDVGERKFYDTEYENIDEALKRARSLVRSLKNTSSNVIVCEETSTMKSKTSTLTVIVCKEVARYPKRKRKTK